MDFSCGWSAMRCAHFYARNPNAVILLQRELSRTARGQPALQ